MTTYTIIPARDGSGFQIGVVGHDGARHTMLGFESEADAEAWIAAEAKMRKKMAHTEKTITGPIINAVILEIERTGGVERSQS